MNFTKGHNFNAPTISTYRWKAKVPSVNSWQLVDFPSRGLIHLKKTLASNLPKLSMNAQTRVYNNLNLATTFATSNAISVKIGKLWLKIICTGMVSKFCGIFTNRSILERRAERRRKIEILYCYSLWVSGPACFNFARSMHSPNVGKTTQRIKLYIYL